MNQPPKKQLKLHLQVDEDQLWTLCKKLPLDLTDRKIAFALAVLCAGTGSYCPDRGVGQKEIARLAGIGVRTVKRRLKHLKQYGILNLTSSNGRSNVYEISFDYLFDAPPLTHNIYKPIKCDPVRAETDTESETKAQPQQKINERQKLLFDVEECAASQQDAPSLLSRMMGAATRFTNRVFSQRNNCQPGPTSAKPGPSVSEPVPNQCQLDLNRGQTGAIVKTDDSQPVPTAELGAETGAKPGPTTDQSSGEPGPNQCQTGANARLHIHKQNTSTVEAQIKNHIKHEHVHVGLDEFHLKPRVAKSEQQSLPPGVRKVRWGRDVREDDLSNPVALQELFEIAVEQGFFLDAQMDRLRFFSLAHYVLRQKKARKKVGLFSCLVDRTSKNKLGCDWEKNIAIDDEEWANKAVKEYDHPPITN